jgi:TatD DNase family protein
MIDTHCHLAYPPLVDDIDGVLQCAQEAGVTQILLPATDRAQSEAVCALAERHENLFHMVGVHPHHVLDTPGDDLEWIHSMGTHEKCVAIGEVGLDYYQTPEPVQEQHDAQREAFVCILGIAHQIQKPLVFHIREAHDDTLALYSQYGQGNPAVVHCFTGGVIEARRWLDMGACLSFTNIAAYKNSSAIREALAYVPEDRFFIETDAPYLPPVYRRGTICEPADVVSVCELVAEVRGISTADAEAITTANARRFFSLPSL